MNEFKRKQLADAFDTLPSDCRSRPATDAQLRAFEAEYGPIPNDFRWFLMRCGGGPVGAEWVDGIDELFESHHKFRAESETENGWTLQGVFIIGWDGAGNPCGIENSTGRILVEDHNFGGIHEMAPSFQVFLERGLLSND